MFERDNHDSGCFPYTSAEVTDAKKENAIAIMPNTIMTIAITVNQPELI